MDETRITQIPPGAVQEKSGDDIRTNEEAVASMGAAEAREETEAYERRLEQSGNDSDDGERSDQLEPVQETVDADPERGGQEDQPDEDPGSGVPEDGDAEEQGEVPADEPGPEETVSQKPVPENQDAVSEGLEEADSTAAVAADEAAKKLKGWKQANKHPYSTLICDHLIKRCGEDAGFAQDVLKESKTWAGCFRFIKGKARNKASEGVACIEDHVVYEWAEDYIRSEEVQESAKAAAGGAKKSTKTSKIARKSGKNARSDKDIAHPDTEDAHIAAEAAQPETDETGARAEEPENKAEARVKKSKSETKEANTKSKELKSKTKEAKPEKVKKDKNEMDGQIDLFSLFG